MSPSWKASMPSSDIFPCFECPQRFPGKQDRQLHKALVHLLKPVKYHRCSLCDEVFPAKDQADRHIIEGHFPILVAKFQLYKTSQANSEVINLDDDDDDDTPDDTPDNQDDNSNPDQDKNSKHDEDIEIICLDDDGDDDDDDDTPDDTPDNQDDNSNPDQDKNSKHDEDIEIICMDDDDDQDQDKRSQGSPNPDPIGPVEHDILQDLEEHQAAALQALREHERGSQGMHSATEPGENDEHPLRSPGSEHSGSVSSVNEEILPDVEVRASEEDTLGHRANEGLQGEPGTPTVEEDPLSNSGSGSSGETETMQEPEAKRPRLEQDSLGGHSGPKRSVNGVNEARVRVRPVRVKSSKYPTCCLCGNTYKDFPTLQAHMNSHMFKCGKKCEFRSTFMDELDRHKEKCKFQKAKVKNDQKL